jgi:pyroglutamyl-peptidase
MRLLVTGFGPFGDVQENPSSILATGTGLEHEILEVSFDAVEGFLSGLNPDSFDALLCLGVSGRAEKMHLETLAKNWIGPAPDVLGAIHGPGPIDPKAPHQLGGTLWRTAELLQETEDWQQSVDAGSYLCNYIYFRALQRLPSMPVGFLHVPSFDKMSQDRQESALQRLIQILSAGSSTAAA